MKARAMAVACLAAVACIALATSSEAATKKGALVNKGGGALKSNGVTGVAKSAVLEAGETKVSCGEGVLKGEVTSTKGGEGLIKFKGCESSGKFPGTGCATGTEPIGTITFPLLWGIVTVGTKDEWEKTIKPETEIVCGPTKILVKGAFFSQVTPEEKLSKTFTLNANSKSEKQTLEISVNSKSFEKAHLPLELKLTLEEEAEFI